MNKRKHSVLRDDLSLAETDTPELHLNDMIQRLLKQKSAFQVFLRRRVGDKALAEDLLQQSMVRAVQSHHSIRNTENVVAWFYKILRHALIDYYRSKEAEARRDVAFLQELTISGADKQPPIDDMKATVCTCLHHLLPALHSNYAELIRRIDLEGEAPKRVAEELKVSQNNLTVRLHRARQALRASLELYCGVCSTHGCLNCTCG